jgi:hypothetical protein
MSPVRTSFPVFTSVMPTLCIVLMMTGGLDHVAPLSFERMTATMVVGLVLWLVSSAKKSIKSPFGIETI